MSNFTKNIMLFVSIVFIWNYYLFDMISGEDLEKLIAIASVPLFLIVWELGETVKEYFVFLPKRKRTSHDWPKDRD